MSTEAELWTAYLGDRTDRNRNAICEFYWQMICRDTQRYLNRRRWDRYYDDVLSYVAEYALTKVIPNFDPTGKYSFQTQMRQGIRATAHETIRSKMGRARVSCERVARVMKKRDTLCQDLGRQVSDAELAEFLEVDEADVLRMLRDRVPVRYVACIESLSPKKQHTQPSGYMEAAEHLVQPLSAFHRALVWMYYIRGYTIREIGDAVGLSHGTVSAELIRAKKIMASDNTKPG